MDPSSLWAKDYSAGGFTLFSAAHLVTLAVLVLLNGSFLLLRGPRCAAARTIFRCTAAFLLFGSEVLLHLWARRNDEWTYRTMLPLQLCSVSQYLAIVMLLTRSRRLYPYVYFLGIGGGLPALLTPSLNYGFPHFRFWEYVIVHVLVVSAPLYLTLAEGFRPCWGSVWRVIVAMNLYLAGAGLFDWLTGSNYLFLCDKPAGPTPFDYLGPWPWYVGSMEGAGVLVILLLYAPFAVHDWRLGRRRLRLADGPGPEVQSSGRPAPADRCEEVCHADGQDPNSRQGGECSGLDGAVAPGAD